MKLSILQVIVVSRGRYRKSNNLFLRKIISFTSLFFNFKLKSPTPLIPVLVKYLSNCMLAVLMTYALSVARNMCYANVSLYR